MAPFYFFFSEIPKYVQIKNRLAHQDWDLWKWASKPAELLGDCEYKLTPFHPVRNFLANEIYLFSNLSFYLGSPLDIISSLFSHFCLFQNAILHKILKLGFWNFKFIFLRMQFSLVATFFSLVLVIRLSWYFHLTISYLTLTRHFEAKVIGLDLSTSPKLAVKWIILKWY